MTFKQEIKKITNKIQKQDEENIQGENWEKYLGPFVHIEMFVIARSRVNEYPREYITVSKRVYGLSLHNAPVDHNFSSTSDFMVDAWKL